MDDAYHYAIQWINDCVTSPIAEWPTERVTAALNRAKAGRVPDRLAPYNVSLFLRPIDLPWKSTADVDAAFRTVWHPRLYIPYVWGWTHSQDYWTYQRSVENSEGKKSLAARLTNATPSSSAPAPEQSTSMDVDNGPILKDDNSEFDDEGNPLDWDPTLPASPFNDSLLPAESGERM
ncbi:hypothetical protein C8J57DRAFT_1239407 [Mycena rebaudengoi]|nr:hypothetical protein C8J57DRAFT_1239407 [Mycena rebaudengoi]